MDVQFDDEKLGQLVETLEEWSAIVTMANMLAAKLPVAVVRDIEANAGPVELWRWGTTMSTLSTETRCAVYEMIQTLLCLVRSQLDDAGLSQRRGLLRLAASAGAS